MVAKNLDHITLVDIRNIRHIYHRHVHTDIANVRCFLSVHQTITGPTSQMAVQSVGIANRNGGYHAVTRQYSLATVADRFFLGDVAKLKNGGLEGGDGS